MKKGLGELRTSGVKWLKDGEAQLGRKNEEEPGLPPDL